MRTGIRNVTRLVAGVLVLLWAARAPAIVINPAPGTLTPAGQALANAIPAGTDPAAGVYGDNTGAGGSFSPFGSGMLINTSVVNPLRGNTFVLTAGHNVAGQADNVGRYQSGVLGGPQLNSNMIRIHPSYNGATNSNDVGLMRSQTPYPTTPYRLAPENTALPNGTGVREIGFGRIDANPSTFTNKRFGIFSVNGTNAAQNSFTMPRAGAGTVDNPTRFSQRGDSGGPYTLTGGPNAGQVVGVHSFGNPNNLTQTTQGAASVTNPLLYNWITSYTQRSIFWDALAIGTNPNGNFNPIVDRFEAGGGGYGYGQDGLAAGWNYSAPGTVIDPRLGANGDAATTFHYFDAIGQTNGGAAPELYRDGVSGQGESITADGLRNGSGMSVIQKDFTVDGGQMLTVSVGQRWNSLYLADDMGVRLPDGTVVWNGAIGSRANTLDQFFLRNQQIDLTNFAGRQTITVYLVNAAVPEPTSLEGVAIGLGVCWVAMRRQRSTRRQRHKSAAV
jgi:hypothetical protein